MNWLSPWPDAWQRGICRSWDGWWQHVQQTLYAELREKRQQAEEAAAEKARQHAELRAAARVRSRDASRTLTGLSLLRKAYKVAV